MKLLILFAGCVVVGRLVWHVHSAWAFSTDDAYVPLRYALNWAEGHGLVWNPGEPPVEGYSSFTFLAIGTVAIIAGVPPMLVLKLVGVVSLMICCVLLWRIARHVVGPTLALASPAIFCASRGSIWWSVSGLETLFYVALALGATLAFLLAEQRSDAPSTRWLVTSAALSGIAGITRPEGPIVAISLLLSGALLLLVRLRGLERGGPGFRCAWVEGASRWGLFAAVFGLVFGIYFAGRLAYYGRLFPNTVYCKAGLGFSGFQLLKDYATLSWPVIGLSLFAWRASIRDPRLIHFAILPLAYVLLLADASPDIGYLHRHVLLAYSLLTVLATVGLSRLCEGLSRLRWRPRTLGQDRLEATALLLVIGMTSAVTWSFSTRLREDAQHYSARMTTRERVVTWINEHTPQDETWGTPDTGLMGYLSESAVLDTMCLNCREATLPPLSRDIGLYGAWVLLQKPKYLVPVVNAHHQITSGWAMAAMRHAPAFRYGYREVAFFPTTKPNFNYAVFERIRDAPAPELANK